MSIDFPASPTNGQTHTAAGATWKYDGAKWISYSSDFLPGPYLPLTGGVLTGALGVQNSTLNSGVTIQNGTAGDALYLFDDGNAHIETNTQLWLNGNTAKAVVCGGSFTVSNQVYINNPDPLHLWAAAGNYCRIFTTVNGVRTWSAGTASDGTYVIADESVAAIRAIIDTSGSFIVNGHCKLSGSGAYYWCNGQGLLSCNGANQGTLIQDSSGWITFQLYPSDNYYDQTNHHFRNRGYYEGVIIYPGASDPLHINVPNNTMNARVWATVQGVRTWSFGAAGDGSFYIADESVTAVRLGIDTSGNVNLQGHELAAGTINVGTANTGNISSGGSIYSASNYYTPSNIWTEHGIHCRQGWYGGWSGNDYAFFWDGTVQSWIDATYCGAIAFQSDYRIKKDVAPLPSMWERVKALRPVAYTHRDFTPPIEIDERAKRGEAGPFFPGDDIERWGFVAHELQETLVASAATGVKDAPNVIQSPNPFTLIAALTRALQEAMTRIEALEVNLV